MQLRKFNEKGVASFAEYLDRLAADPTAPPPTGLLHDTLSTDPLAEPIVATPKVFTTRMEFAGWLSDAAQASNSRVAMKDAGFWAWMSLLLFDLVCPVINGRRKVGERARYIPSTDWRRRYRHLLATPFSVFMIHRDEPSRAAVILNHPLHVLGELTEQIASRQELVSCPGTMALATMLFIDPATNRPRSGASGIAARRLGTLLNQYTRTWDITMMPAPRAAALLPAEFDRFRPTA